MATAFVMTMPIRRLILSARFSAERNSRSTSLLWMAISRTFRQRTSPASRVGIPGCSILLAGRWEGDVIGLTIAEALLRLGLAVLVGMAIGFEREWREKAAGFRTITLVTAGSALFVMAGTAVFTVTDASRVAQGVVTGIGFLGAGAILRDRGQVVGLTTAAAVWAACALGICAGFGAYALAVGGTMVVLVVLLVFPRLEISGLAHDQRTYQVVAPFGEEALHAYTRRFTDAGLQVRRRTIRRAGDGMTVTWEAVGRPRVHEAVTAAFLGDESVAEVEVY